MGLSECYLNSSSYSPNGGNRQPLKEQLVEAPPPEPAQIVVSQQGNLPGVPTPDIWVTLVPEQMKVISDCLEQQLLINKAILMLLIFFIMIKLCNK